MSEEKLTIIWEDAPFVDKPLSGVGTYKNKSVYFRFSDNEDYCIYEMSPESEKIICEEHVRFINEVGYYRNYGKSFSQGGGNGETLVMFKYKYTFEDLKLDMIDTIKYKSINNPFPHMVV